MESDRAVTFKPCAHACHDYPNCPCCHAHDSPESIWHEGPDGELYLITECATGLLVEPPRTPPLRWWGWWRFSATLIHRDARQGRQLIGGYSRRVIPHVVGGRTVSLIWKWGAVNFTWRRPA